MNSMTWVIIHILPQVLWIILIVMVLCHSLSTYKIWNKRNTSIRYYFLPLKTLHDMIGEMSGYATYEVSDRRQGSQQKTKRTRIQTMVAETSTIILNLIFYTEYKISISHIKPHHKWDVSLFVIKNVIRIVEDQLKMYHNACMITYVRILIPNILM